MHPQGESGVSAANGRHAGPSGPAAAACLRAMDRLQACAPRPDLVWSGPEVPGLHPRDTQRV